MAQIRPTHRLGWALLDHGSHEGHLPQSEPILEPELEWERVGWVPNVVFSCGQVVADGVVTLLRRSRYLIGSLRRISQILLRSARNSASRCANNEQIAELQVMF